MTDLRFHNRKGPFKLGELAHIGQCTIIAGSPELEIHDVAPLENAIAGTLSVFHDKRYIEGFKKTKASACIINENAKDLAPHGITLLTSPYPQRSYALIANTFYPSYRPEAGIASTAQIDPTAELGQGCSIGHYVVIGPHAKIGENVVIKSHTVIGDFVEIGDHSTIEEHVTISYALIGKNVYIKPGARIGQKGFGFFMDSGSSGGHVSLPQLGRVIIEDYVEIGSNATIDRGNHQDTIIGKGTRLDNLVQIAHNVQFGKGCVIVAQTGVAGSTVFGDFVATGGQVGIIDHLKIGSGVRIAAQSGIMTDIKPGEVVCGSPAVPVKSHYRQVAILHKLANTDRKKRK